MRGGRYWFCNASDDIAHPTTIERLHEVLSNLPSHVLAVPDNEMIDEDGRRCFWTADQEVVYEPVNGVAKTFFERFKLRRPELQQDPESFGTYDSLLFGKCLPNGYLIRMEALRSTGGYDPSLALEDWSMHLNLAKQGKFAFIDEVLFSYRWHSANAIRANRFRDDNLATLSGEKAYCLEYGYEKVWREAWRKRRPPWKGLRKRMFTIKRREG